MGNSAGGPAHDEHLSARTVKLLLGLLIISRVVFGCPARLAHEGELRVGHVVINEVLFNLPEERDLEEWVELYNNADRPVNLKGWTLDDRDTHRFEFQNDLILMPGQYLVFFTNAEHTKQFSTLESQGVLSVAYQTAGGNPLNQQIWNNDGDEILLQDENGTIIDYIEFGEPGGDGRDPTPAGAVWHGYIPIPPPGYGIALFPNGYDLDSSANWGFRAPQELTPGAANF